MNRMLIFVVGAKNAGKTTFSHALAHVLTGVHIETTGVVMDEYRRLTGCVIKDAEKETYRADLEQLGDLITNRCKSRIIELILANPDIQTSTAPLIISGVRRRAELFEGIELAEANGYAVRTVSIERGGHRDTDEHFEVRRADVQAVVENDFGAEHLRYLAGEYSLALPVEPATI